MTPNSSSPGRGISPDVAELTRDWRRLQTQKWRLRGGVEARFLTNLAMRLGEQYIAQARDALMIRPFPGKDEAMNQLSLVFNLIKKQRDRKIGHLWRIAHEFRASPSTVDDPRALDKSEVVTKGISGISRKLQEHMLHWQRLSWLVDTGVVIEHTPWVEESAAEPIPAFDPETNELLYRDAMNPDPNAVMPHSLVLQLCQRGATPERFQVIEHLQIVGDVGAEIISGFNFFIDASVPMIKQLGPGQRCYIAQIKTIDFVRENFGNEGAQSVQQMTGNDLGIVRTRLLDRGPSVANMNLRDMIPAVQGTRVPQDPPMCILLTGYEPASRKYPHGRRVIFTPNGPMLDDSPGPYGEIPCTDLHYEAPNLSFWTGDFITDLVPANKFLNKRMSQLGEAANAQLYELILLGGELSKRDVPTDIHGIVEGGLDENGQPLVQSVPRGQLPSFMVESIRLVIELLLQIGAVDLMDHRNFPGQIRGPMALPIIDEMLASEDGPRYQHIGEQLAQIHQQRMNRVKQFYPPIRTLHYVGKNKKDEALLFHTEALLRSGTDYLITVDPATIYPENSALKEARIIERLSGPLAGLYTDSRTGRLDFSKIAFELRFTDVDDEDRQGKIRKLMKHLIGRLWQGEPLSQTLPEVPYPFWDHNVVLDELDAAMITTEWIESSPQVKAEFQQMFERSRQYLAAIQDAQAQAIESQMMRGVVAQTSQQVAARVAAETTDQALQQINTNLQMARAQPPQDQIAAAVARERSQGTPQAPSFAQGPTRPQ